MQAIADAGFTDVEVVGETDASALLAGAEPADPLVAAVLAAFGDAEELRRHLASTTSIWITYSSCSAMVVSSASSSTKVSGCR